MFQTTTQQFAPIQQPLPYNPQGPQWQAVQVNINNLPVNLTVLQNQVHPNLLQYLPAIAVATIDALQNRAGQNALRMFLYNQMADNSYNNNPFLTLIKTICDVAEYHAATGTQLEQAISGSIDLCIQFSALSNVKAYPALQQYLDQNAIAGLQALEQKQNQLGIAIQGYMQQKAARNNQGYNAQGFINQGFAPQAQINMQNQPFNGFAPNTPQQPGTWNNQSTGMFTSGAPQAPEPNQSKMVNSWDNQGGSTQSWRNPEPPQVQAPQTAQQPSMWSNQPVAAPAPFKFNTPNPAPVVSQPAAKPALGSEYPKTYNYDGRIMVKQKDPGVVWKPSNRWPVNISDSYMVDVYYVLHEDGSMEPIIKKLSQEEKMEKLKHMDGIGRCHPAWRKILADDHIERVLALEKRGYNRDNVVVEGPRKRSQETVKGENVVQDTAHLIITSEDEALCQTDVAMASIDTPEKPCEAYTKPALRVTPIVSRTDAEGLIEELSESVSLEQCASMLNVESYAISAMEDPDKRRRRQIVYGKLNRMLTASVNHYLKYRLGLPACKIDSFDQDGKDILKYLETEYPENYSVCMRKHQKNIIKHMLATTTDGNMGTDFDECVREQQMPESNPYGLEPIFLYSKEIYMSVNDFSCNLMLELDEPGEVLAVYADAQPLAYSLCGLLVGKGDDDVYAHYMKTVDDVVYEVHRSALNDDVYLIGIKRT